MFHDSFSPSKYSMKGLKWFVAQTGAVQQTNEYYPFGDLFATSGTEMTGNGK